MLDKHHLSRLVIVLGAVVIGMTAVPGFSQGQSGKAIVLQSTHAVSAPLRDMVPQPMSAEEDHELAVRPIPRNPGAYNMSLIDSALQQGPGPLVPAFSGLNLEGVGANCCAPSDDNAAVGATQVVQWVNLEYAVYDKATGNLLKGPLAGNQIWANLGGPCFSNNSGDIIAQYDKLNSRWVLSQPVFTAPYYDCFAVSQTSDATGAYNLYAFPLPSNSTYFPDYPKTGIWSDAYYRTYNIFFNLQNFIGGQVCAFDGAAMRAGLPATAQCFNRDNSALTCNATDCDGGLLPSDVDGTTAPPLTEPNLILELDRTTANSNLDLWKFHVDFVIPGNSTFTGPTVIPVAPWNYACGGSGGTCVPQIGTTQKLDTLGDRMMYRTPYRNFAGNEILLASHTVDVGGITGVRWYEISNPNGSPSIAQQGTYSPDSTWRWMGSIAMDKNQDIALGYSASSLDMHPAIRYTGRLASDPLGTMDSEDLIFQGLGSQTGGLTRWGDYTSMSVDPTDDCTMWYTNQYEASSGSFNWHTRLYSFVFNGCVGAAGPDYTLSASPSSVNVNQGSNAIYTVTIAPVNGFTGSVTLSAQGLPTGSTATFTPNPVTGGSGTSTLSVSTSGGTPLGTYTLSIDGNSSGDIHGAFVNMAVQMGASATLTPATLPFGNQGINTTSAVKKLTLKNTGGTAVTVSSIGISGTNASDFAQSNNCPASLNAGKSCQISVTYTPSILGAETASVNVVDSAGTQTSTLTGNGVGDATLLPVKLAFANQAINTSSAGKAVTLKNNTPTAITISSVTFSNPDYARTGGTCGSTLAGKAGCTIIVTFTPTVLGSDPGTVTVNESAPAPYNTLTSSLTGTGVAQATLMPTSLGFGSIKVGNQSASKNVTLHNNLPTALTISGFTFTGADPGDYLITSQTCGATLAAKSSCTVSVAFKPTTTGSRTATLNANDSANNNPQTTSLSGTGK